MFAVAGDWHGSKMWGVTALDRCALNGVSHLLHVGDFTIDLRRYTQHLEPICAETGVTIWVTPGNHDDYSVIPRLMEDHPDEDVVMLTEYIGVIRRGSVFELDGLSVLSIGGAPSIDKQMRTWGIDWWPEEAIRVADVYRANEAGRVDVVVSHDAPNSTTPIVDKRVGVQPVWMPDDLKVYLDQNRLMLDAVRDIAQPSLWIHGHHHVFETVSRNGTRYVALANEFSDRNLAFIDPAGLVRFPGSSTMRGATYRF